MWYILAGLVIMTLFLILAKKPNNKVTKQDTNTTLDEPPKEPKEKADYTYSYHQKWLFTYNEKNAYRSIRKVTDELGYILFAKVRLFDLIEPRKDCGNYKGAMWKIQAKHLDFVVCDSNLVARWVIELDDSSHNAKERIDRDTFVNAVLMNCGYKVMHTRYVTEDTLKDFFNN